MMQIVPIFGFFQSHSMEVRKKPPGGSQFSYLPHFAAEKHINRVY